ncbi:hypothetical protein CICLE_v10023516mg [Citrus x clementina]|uniref:Uncharacterized protein n=1 Tax=Citrus clementina TaxID=85681 RepID=V4TZ36_CITCL|nr:hypothetical protein CICLE_v10023516mg [Citrus x clementina]
MTSIQRKEAIRFVTIICLREKEKKRSHKKLWGNCKQLNKYSASPNIGAVKEVLSETRKPKPKPNPYPVFAAHMKQELQQQQEREQEKEAKISDSPRKVEAFAKNAQDKQNLSSSNEEEIMSQVSKICSVSVSESLSTMTNVTDMRDIEDGESPAKPPPRNGFRRDRVVNQSPTRRSDQSPARRIGSGSPV